MSLETATKISELNSSNPVGGDARSQGDDHIRMLKACLQFNFPNADKAFYFPKATTKSAGFTIVATDLNKTFMVSTSGGDLTATLPSLAAGDDGWVCHFIKTSSDVNAIFVTPASGTVTSGEFSGLARARRAIPGQQFSAIWTGTAWFITRVPKVPVGTILDFQGTLLPAGYEWANGQTLGAASTQYPEYFSLLGSGITMDLRGRVAAGQDDMGGSSANRLTGLAGGIDGDGLGNVGGSESHTLTEAQLASHNHGGTAGADGAHLHFVANSDSQNIGSSTPLSSVNSLIATLGGGAGDEKYTLSGSATTPNIGKSSSDGSHTHSISSAGSGAAHNIVQPTIITNKIIVVE